MRKIHGLAALFGCALTACPAQAAVIHVDQQAQGGNNGTSWSNAFTDLQAAISAAVHGDEIWVAAGTYVPGSQRSDSFALVDGVGLYGGFAGTETVRDQRDVGSNATILSCDINGDDVTTFATGEALYDYVNDNPGAHDRVDNCYTVIEALPVSDGSAGTLGRDTIVDGFTVTKGQADGPPDEVHAPQINGGGMYIPIGADITVRNMRFVENYSFLDGGGVTQHADALLQDSVFERNATCDGGGFASTEHIGLPKWPGGTARNVLFASNYANCEGGGFHIGRSNATISGCVATGNKGREATTSNDGAGAGGGGGAIQLSDSSITDCVFFNNSSGTAGGLEVGPDQGQTVQLRNLTFIKNSSSANAGGLAVGLVPDGAASALSLSNGVFIGNTSAGPEGRQIYNGAGGQTLSVTHTFIEGGIDSTASVVGNVVAVGPIFQGDPGFEVTDFSDPSVTNFRLAADSQLRDAGDPQQDYSGASDYEGQARVMGPCDHPIRVDVGADEVFYPSCWNSATQCNGDANEDGTVNFQDYAIFAQACAGGSGSCNTVLGDLQYDACADFDHDGDVDTVDEMTLQSLMFQAAPQNCMCGDAFPPPTP